MFGLNEIEVALAKKFPTEISLAQRYPRIYEKLERAGNIKAFLHAIQPAPAIQPVQPARIKKKNSDYATTCPKLIKKAHTVAWEHALRHPRNECTVDEVKLFLEAEGITFKNAGGIFKGNEWLYTGKTRVSLRPEVRGQIRIWAIKPDYIDEFMVLSNAGTDVEKAIVYLHKKGPPAFSERRQRTYSPASTWIFPDGKAYWEHILELFHAEGPLTLDQVIQRMSEQHPGCSKLTVGKSVKQLIEKKRMLVYENGVKGKGSRICLNPHTTQIDKILKFVNQWKTVQEFSDVTGIQSHTSLSAQLRNLRKVGWEVSTKYRAGTKIKEYKIENKSDTPILVIPKTKNATANFEFADGRSYKDHIIDTIRNLGGQAKFTEIQNQMLKTGCNYGTFCRKLHDLIKIGIVEKTGDGLKLIQESVPT